jgi:hypothetical protein
VENNQPPTMNAGAHIRRQSINSKDDFLAVDNTIVGGFYKPVTGKIFKFQLSIVE